MPHSQMIREIEKVAPNKETVAVYLLDDDASILKATSRLLDSVGWKVEAFTDPFAFLEREGLPGYYSGEGEMTSIRPGRNLWETNFVPDLGAFELKPWEARGAGSSNIQLLISEGSIGAHVSEMPVGTYKKGHRHGPGLHIFFIHGSGYTLLWYEGDRDFKRVDWRHGMCFAPHATARSSSRPWLSSISLEGSLHRPCSTYSTGGSTDRCCCSCSAWRCSSGKRS